MRKACYKKLWKLLIDKDMNKKMLGKAANVSTSSITKLSKGENVYMDVIIRICDVLDCEVADIVELVPSSNPESEK